MTDDATGIQPPDMGSVSHCAVVDCDVAAPQAFAFLADGLRLGQWALGAWDTVDVGGGVVRGHSLFDDQPIWVHPVADASRHRVDYHVGLDPSQLSPRIAAWVEALEPTPGSGARCRISLHAQRESMDDARWLRLVRCHDVEVLLIGSRLAAEALRSS